MDTDATTTTTNNKGNGNKRGFQFPLRCRVCKSTFQTARDPEQHRNSGIHDDHSVTCELCQRISRTLSGVRFRTKITSDGKDSVLHSSTILVLRLGRYDCTKVFEKSYKRFAHIVFTSPAGATGAQEAIDGLVVNGRKLVCDKVPVQDHGNMPRTLSITPVVYSNPSRQSQRNPQSSRREHVKRTAPVTQRNPQSSRRVIVESSQEAVPAAKGAKEVSIDLTGDENTVDDRSDCVPPRTAPAADHSIASAGDPVSQAGTTTLAGAEEVTTDLACDENTINDDRSDCVPPRTAPAADHSTASASDPVSQASTTTLAGAEEVTIDLAGDENTINDDLSDRSPPSTAAAVEHSKESASDPVSQAGTTTLAAAKEVTTDLAGDENTINDDPSDRSPSRTAAAADHSTASASDPVSQAGTRKRPHRSLSPSESSRSRDPSPETPRKQGRFDDDPTPVKSNQDNESSAAENRTSEQENQGAGPVSSNQDFGCYQDFGSSSAPDTRTSSAQENQGAGVGRTVWAIFWK
ncbi:hypothetical protein HK104_008719 [Borealophlyctis nickersoniae]|nr:hypothetical protein HK104_008719 [Borealophlyctis nickersoniae]